MPAAAALLVVSLIALRPILAAVILVPGTIRLETRSLPLGCRTAVAETKVTAARAVHAAQQHDGWHEAGGELARQSSHWNAMLVFARGRVNFWSGRPTPVQSKDAKHADTGYLTGVRRSMYIRIGV